MSYLNKFQTHTDYANETFVAPNVSACVEDGHVHYMGFPKTNGYDYVDLGLPSGTLWATCNVGANSPEEYGDYYAWGEVIPNKAATYTWDNYKFGTENALTKYNRTDNKMTLDLEDDAAHVVMGGDWHIPTYEQFQELDGNTTNSWTTDYNGTGIAGIIFTSSVNNASIFFPSANSIWNDGMDHTVPQALIWSSSRYNNPASDAFYFDITEDYVRINNNTSRYPGFSVRGVIGEWKSTEEQD